MTNPIGHFLIYGDPGAGKSTGAATFPKPMIVFMFDPFGKDGPYVKRGVASGASQTAAMLAEASVSTGGLLTDPNGTPYREVFSRTNGRVIIRIEHFLDSDPTKPEAFKRFVARLTRLDADLAQWGIQTVVLDSVTFAELAARKWQQYVLNPQSREPRQWFAGSTDALEEVLMIRFGSLQVNVVVVAHIDEDKDEVHGTMVRNPAAPGRLRKRGPAGFSELYRAYVKRVGDKGEREFLWQTRSDALYNCASQVDAPEPCQQDYRAIWVG